MHEEVPLSNAWPPRFLHWVSYFNLLYLVVSSTKRCELLQLLTSTCTLSVHINCNQEKMRGKRGENPWYSLAVTYSKCEVIVCNLIRRLSSYHIYFVSVRFIHSCPTEIMRLTSYDPAAKLDLKISFSSFRTLSSERHKIHMSLALALLLAQSLFLSGNKATRNKVLH